MIKRIKDFVNDNYKTIFVVATILTVVFVVLLIIIGNTRDYTKVTLQKNNNTIFSQSDLVVDEVKYTDKEKTIRKKYGKPKKEEKYKKDVFSYKKLYYNGITFILRENYADYMLIGVEIDKTNHKTSRGIKVGKPILNAIKSYKIDNKKGMYMYGNYSAKSLNGKDITEIIYMGIRGKKEVTYIYRDPVIKNEKTNTARLTFTYKSGKIKKINWIYDFE